MCSYRWCSNRARNLVILLCHTRLPLLDYQRLKCTFSLLGLEVFQDQYRHDRLRVILVVSRCKAYKGHHFRKHVYNNIEQLRSDLDDWLEKLNTERTHQDKRDKMFCGRTPFETLIDGKKNRSVNTKLSMIVTAIFFVHEHRQPCQILILRV